VRSSCCLENAGVHVVATMGAPNRVPLKPPKDMADCHNLATILDGAQKKKAFHFFLKSIINLAKLTN
jgi:hypothetical protein